MAGFALSSSDWVVVAAFFGINLFIVWRRQRRQANASDYFLDGRRTHWIIVGVSLYATLFSTVSFVGMPGEAYKNGVLYGLYSVGYFLVTPFAMWLLLRFFYNRRAFTAYEYLERRFDVRVRTAGAILFLAARVLSGATIFYAAAILFRTLVGWDARWTILGIGGVTILYAYVGGMRAVMMTDFVQTLAMIAGMGCLVLRLLQLVGFHVGAVWHFASGHGHGLDAVLTRSFFSFDPHARFTFWVLVALSVINPLNNYGTDQLVVQRILSSSSYAAARRAIWLKIVAALPLSAIFYFIGLLLFFYYHSGGAQAPDVEADQILGYFIRRELPPPFPGVIVAALLGALMAAVSSTVSSLSTVATVDLVQRLRPGPLPPDALVRLGKGFTVAGGAVILALTLALVFASGHAESTIIEIANVSNSLWGVLLVIVLAGILTTGATAGAAFWALVVGLVVNSTLPWLLYFGVSPDRRISFAWVGVPGMALTAVIVIVGSCFDRRKNRNLADLTWKTRMYDDPAR